MSEMKNTLDVIKDRLHIEEKISELKDITVETMQNKIGQLF